MCHPTLIPPPVASSSQRRSLTSAAPMTVGMVLLLANVVAATPTPTSTPTMILLRGAVRRPGSTESLVPTANVTVSAFQCPNPATCLRGGALPLLASAITAANGMFALNVSAQPTFLVLEAALVGSTLRTFVPVFSSSQNVSIDPISEAAVQLIDERGLQSYENSGISEILAAVRSANAPSDFHGLGVEDAVALGRTVASDDAEVQRLLATRMVTPTFTRSATATRTPTPTRTATPSLTPTATPTPRRTATPRSCVGDCSYDGDVTVEELVAAVQIALGGLPIDACRAADRDGDGSVTVDEVVDGVNNALNLCAGRPPAADLIPSTLRAVVPPGCAPLAPATYVEVCVANIGDTAAAGFTVRVATELIEIAGVASGEEICAATMVSLMPASIVVQVDTTGAIPDSRRDNNQATFEIAAPPAQSTCTPTQTATATASRTPT